jgi:putative spermidine/putrescine transport system permease protein
MGTAMKRIGDRWATALFVILMILTVTFLLLPVFVALVMSFDSRNYLGTFPPPGLSFKWYHSFLVSSEYLKGLRTSLTVATISAGLATLIGGAAAVFLDRNRFRGREILTAFFLSPLVVPGVVMGFALLMFFSLCGIYDGYTRLLGGHVLIALPYTIRTTLASLAGIRRSLTEAALSLGANERAAFWEITLPLCKTGVAAGGVFAFALSMDEVAASLFLADPFAYTLPVAIIGQMRSRFDLTIAAVSGVLVLFTVLLIVLLERLVGLDRLIGVGIYRA